MRRPEGVRKPRDVTVTEKHQSGLLVLHENDSLESVLVPFAGLCEGGRGSPGCTG